jgi:hypothetical protein
MTSDVCWLRGSGCLGGNCGTGATIDGAWGAADNGGMAKGGGWDANGSDWRGNDNGGMVGGNGWVRGDNVWRASSNNWMGGEGVGMENGSDGIERRNSWTAINIAWTPSNFDWTASNNDWVSVDFIRIERRRGWKDGGSGWKRGGNDWTVGGSGRMGGGWGFQISDFEVADRGPQAALGGGGPRKGAGIFRSTCVQPKKDRTLTEKLS